MPALHTKTHPFYVDGCWACKALSVHTNLSMTTRQLDAKDRELSKDLDAYQRLRRQGLQPEKIDGCHQLEGTVESQLDLTLGRHVPRDEMDRVREGMALSKDLGLTTVVPD